MKDARNKAKAKADSRSEIKKEVGNLKEDQARLFEQLKEADRARDSFEADHQNAKK